MLTETIDQSRWETAKKKEAKLKQCLMIGDINRHSIIMNDKKGLENIQDYNDMAVWLEMMNADKDVKTKDSSEKRVE